MLFVERDTLKAQREVTKSFPVPTGDHTPSLVAIIQPWQFPGKHQRLNGIHLTIQTHKKVVVLSVLTQLSKAANAFIEQRRTGHYRPGVASRRKVLAGVKAETSHAA